MSETSQKPWHEVLASLTPLILGVCVTGVGASFTAVYNYRQLQLNQLAALDKFRPSLVSDSPIEREFAYASFAALGYEDLALKIIQLKRDSAGRSVAQDIQIHGSASAKAEAKATLSTLPVQVFGHIGAESQRIKATEALSALHQKGYVPVGVENISGKAIAPKRTEVRYFNEEDKTSADGVAEILRAQGSASAQARRVSLFTVKPGILEVWFGAEAL